MRLQHFVTFRALSLNKGGGSGSCVTLPDPTHVSVLVFFTIEMYKKNGILCIIKKTRNLISTFEERMQHILLGQCHKICTPQFYFTKPTHQGPRLACIGIFEYGFDFAEIFE